MIGAPREQLPGLWSGRRNFHSRAPGMDRGNRNRTPDQSLLTWGRVDFQKLSGGCLKEKGDLVWGTLPCKGTVFDFGPVHRLGSGDQLGLEN